MANLELRLSENVPGRFFVDSTCIDCGACRQLAPETFAEAADSSYVHQQPQGAKAERRALHALLTCPTHSIGSSPTLSARAAMEDFPLLIEGDVYYCGFNSEKSFGAHSYFIRHPAGNWLIDSPRWTTALVQKFSSLGGLSHIFLTHRDDVADAHAYARHFGCERIIHERDQQAQPEAERKIAGEDILRLGEDFTLIPTPGHTRGHMILLYRDRYLFTGDHLWGRGENKLGASHGVCWYSWEEQIRSMERLQAFAFDWVLPGHGARVRLPVPEMGRALADLIRGMKEKSKTSQA